MQQVAGMTRIAPKPGKSGRPIKSENFAINEPGREPFYVHAYHGGGPEHCADLQVREYMDKMWRLGGNFGG